MYDNNGKPRCDMVADCDQPTTYLDDNGYIYCAGHGRQRQVSRKCRKMRPHEVRRIERGEQIDHY
jgi:hypothetical protein